MENKQQAENEAYYSKKVVASLRIGFVALMLFLSFFILKPFLILVAWSIIIAVGIYPMFTKMTKMLGGRKKLASTLIILVALVLIIVPSTLMLTSTVDSIQNIREDFKAGTLVVPPPSEKVAEWPVIGNSVYNIWNGASKNLEKTLVDFGPQIKGFVLKLLDSLAGVGGTILLTIISIIIAAFLVINPDPAEKTSAKIFELLTGKDGKDLTRLTVLTIRSVVQGILGIAIIQSLGAAILMFAYGIPGAGLWAIIVLFLAIVQLPPAVILLPVAIYAFSIMGTTSAVIFLILATFVSVSDTFLKPLLLGRGVDIPMLVILLGAIGGMITMGILGLFVGAVILALSYKIFQALLSDGDIEEINDNLSSE